MGAGSSWNVLLGTELISFATSSTVTAALLIIIIIIIIINRFV